jgi:hypothetical protein
MWTVSLNKQIQWHWQGLCDPGSNCSKGFGVYLFIATAIVGPTLFQYNGSLTSRMQSGCGADLPLIQTLSWGFTWSAVTMWGFDPYLISQRTSVLYGSKEEWWSIFPVFYTFTFRFISGHSMTLQPFDNDRHIHHFPLQFSSNSLFLVSISLRQLL